MKNDTASKTSDSPGVDGPRFDSAIVAAKVLALIGGFPFGAFAGLAFGLGEAKLPLFLWAVLNGAMTGSSLGASVVGVYMLRRLNAACTRFFSYVFGTCAGSFAGALAVMCLDNRLVRQWVRFGDKQERCAVMLFVWSVCIAAGFLAARLLVKRGACFSQRTQQWMIAGMVTFLAIGAAVTYRQLGGKITEDGIFVIMSLAWSIFGGTLAILAEAAVGKRSERR